MLLRYAAVCGLLCATVFAQRKVIDDAEAKKTFESVCSGCLSLRVSTNVRATHDEWMELAQRMSDKGANATDDQYFAIVDYLTKNHGSARLNVNRAEAADLAAFFAISDADADAMVKWRSANGAFKTTADLVKGGADQKKVDAKKDAIDF